LYKKQDRITKHQDELHDLAEESTNGVFASPSDEDMGERKINLHLIDEFIKKRKSE
jgi:hypothetical protein